MKFTAASKQPARNPRPQTSIWSTNGPCAQLASAARPVGANHLGLQPRESLFPGIRDMSLKSRMAMKIDRAKVFAAVPIDGATMVEIVATLGGRHRLAPVRNALKKLARAGLIDASTTASKKQGGPARLVFRRRPGVRFNAAKLARRKPSDPPPIAIPKGVASEIAPNVEMQIGPWHRDRQGNLVRYITGVAARRDDDGVADDASAVTRRGGSRRLVQARARAQRNPASRNNGHAPARP